MIFVNKGWFDHFQFKRLSYFVTKKEYYNGNLCTTNSLNNAEQVGMQFSGENFIQFEKFHKCYMKSSHLKFLAS